jgi:cysteinyl-tRNA synthetase
MHFGFLNIDNEKMSKSLGNFLTAREILKSYSAEAIRLSFAQTHYAGPLNFSDDLLSSAEKGLEKLKNLAGKIEEEIKSGNSHGNIPSFNFEKFRDNFESAMDDDFNTSQACGVIFDFIREVNKAITGNEDINVKFYLDVKSFLQKTAEGVLGIMDFSETKIQDNLSLENDLIELFIKFRNDAKKEKNFALSDKIRDELKAIGVILEDGKEKTTYKKTK